MANPRQRRKARSGASKVKSSRRQQDRLRKVDPRGPPALVEAWDKTKTPRQNWKAFGLLGSKLDPRLAGGVERITRCQDTWIEQHRTPDALESGNATAETQDLNDSDGDDNEEYVPEDFPAPTSHSTELAPNEGRIIRDPHTGKILSVVLGNENTQTRSTSPLDNRTLDTNDGHTPWGHPLVDFEPRTDDFDAHVPTSQGISYRPISSPPLKTKTALVTKLEEIASRPTPKCASTRFASTREFQWLQGLVSSHGEDYAAMARDRRANTLQRTPGQIRQAVMKAGGISLLQALPVQTT